MLSVSIYITEGGSIHCRHSKQPLHILIPIKNEIKHLIQHQLNPLDRLGIKYVCLVDCTMWICPRLRLNDVVVMAIGFVNSLFVLGGRFAHYGQITFHSN